MTLIFLDGILLHFAQYTLTSYEAVDVCLSVVDGLTAGQKGTTVNTTSSARREYVVAQDVAPDTVCRLTTPQVRPAQ